MRSSLEREDFPLANALGICLNVWIRRAQNGPLPRNALAVAEESTARAPAVSQSESVLRRPPDRVCAFLMKRSFHYAILKRTLQKRVVFPLPSHWHPHDPVPHTIERGKRNATLDRGGPLVPIEALSAETQRPGVLTAYAAAPQSPIGMSPEPKGCLEIGTTSHAGGFLKGSVT